MNFRNITLVTLMSVTAFAFACANSAKATVVATISGSYDLLYYDTSALTFHNTSGGSFTNAKMMLHGYQGLNNNVTQTVNLGTLAVGDTDEKWGFLPGGAGCCGVAPGDLTSYDYDDEWGNSAAPNPACIQPYPLCAQVGNFSVTFTATIAGGLFDGKNVFSVFSPTSNATGGFVGWEGLDPDGLSETIYDAHQGSITGTLAKISLGDPPPPGVPEPASWALMIGGFGLAGAALRRRRAAA